MASETRSQLRAWATRDGRGLPAHGDGRRAYGDGSRYSGGFLHGARDGHGVGVSAGGEMIVNVPPEVVQATVVPAPYMMAREGPQPSESSANTRPPHRPTIDGIVLKYRPVPKPYPCRHTSGARFAPFSPPLEKYSTVWM